jgi:catalase
MFAYADAARYRLGVNYTQLPPNRAICPVFAPFERDGYGTITRNYGGEPNYVRRTLSTGRASQQAVYNSPVTERIERDAILAQNEIQVDDEDYIQPRDFWFRVFDDNERRLWISNVAETLETVPPQLRAAVAAMFSNVDARIGQALNAEAKSSAHI